MRTSLRSSLPTLLTLLALTAAAGCGSQATTSTATSPSSISRCAVTGNVSGQVPAQGGAGSLAVTAARECAWSASVDGQWLTIKAGANGQGDGSVEFAAAANPDPAIRRGAIVLNDARVEVMQAAGECSYSLSEAAASFSQTGGSGQFEVRASSGLCTWTAQADAPWVVVRSGASSKGTATVQFDVAATTGQARSATITAAGARFSVSQQPAECAFSVTPLMHSAPAAGGPLTVTVTTAPTCTWTASTAASWVSLSSPASVTGTGTATFSVAASSVARAGSVVVAGRTVAINQGAAPCSFALSSDSAAVPASGGGGRVVVSTAAACAWNASSNAPWLVITAGASGSGPGEVSYQATPTNEARSGALTIAGQIFTVTQSPGCSYSLSAAGATMPPEGGAGVVGVNAAGGCPWTAASNANWLTITAGTIGNGPGSVGFTAAPQSGGSRSGTLTIAGQTFTITQAAGCTFTIAPEVDSIDAEGGSKTIKVTAPGGCAWTAASNVPWITVRESGDTGSHDVHVTIAANTGPARSGTATIAGRILTINQAAFVCSYKVSPLEMKVNEDARIAKIDIETTAGCSWTAVSNALWIRVVYNASGTGSGDTWIGIPENDGKTRTGTLTVAGQTVTVTQKDK
jgi:hypothetical protein